MQYSKIIGLGHSVPETVVTNDDLSKILDTTDEWIVERTGIRERRFFDPNIEGSLAKMAKKAAEMALERAKMSKDDIDFIIFASITPDYFFPGSSVLLQREMGMGTIGCLDIRNACSGFIYSISVADQFIKTGMYKNIMVVGGEIQSTAIDMTDRGRSTAVIFGDGVGVAILSASDEKGILSTHLHAEGTHAEELFVKDPGSSRSRDERQPEQILDTSGYKVYMNGNMVFKHAVVRFHEVIEEALNKNDLKSSDIDMLIPHQANLRISKFIQSKLGLSDDNVFNNIQKYGNTTAASIPIALSEAWEEGKINSGDLVCLAAFGSGFTWGSALIRW
ncbi:ketoacyl-ACP synthase III [Marivirga sp. S37H4]|uniref:Beta-ketoacyl-[acyl-carrier-protein] synthase III n=1 Tax=Marivirga aurantiaca TaxID=2802615 RepID=A0A935C9P0_9BACT|nr:beta-ketoacyl-ACP synthase III [Marivirga aurantiaca]MBK6266276.1 ketoacyl-ACP synthase III [Marivirga aurantiaca]